MMTLPARKDPQVMVSPADDGELWRVIAEDSLTAMAVFESQTLQLTWANGCFWRLLGYHEVGIDLYGQHAERLIGGAAGQRLAGALREVVATGRSCDDIPADERCEGPAGWHLSIRPIRTCDGAVWLLLQTRVAGVEAPAKELAFAEPREASAGEVLRETSMSPAGEGIRRLAAVVEGSDDFIGVASLDRQAIYLNRAGQCLVGLEGDEAVRATKVEDYFFPEDVAIVRERILPAVLRGGRWSGEFRFRHFQSGEPIAVLWSIFPVDNPQTGEPIELAMIARDIRPLKVIEKTLRDREQRLSLAAQAAQLGVFEWNAPDDSAVWENERMYEIFGHSHAEKTLSYEALTTRVMHPEDVAGFERALAEAMQSGQMFQHTCRIHREDTGELRWVEYAGRFELAENGLPVRLIGVLGDVTERKQIEEKLKRQRELSQRIIDSIPVMIMLFDPRLQRLRFNPEMRRVLGWTEDDVVDGGYLANAFPDPNYRRMVSEFIESLEPGWQDLLVTAKDGSMVESSWAFIRLSDDSQVGIGIDMRQRKAAEESLARSAHQRLLLAEVSARVVAQSTLQGLLETVVQAARQLTDARVATSCHGEAPDGFRVAAVSHDEEIAACAVESLQSHQGHVYRELSGDRESIRVSQQDSSDAPAWQQSFDGTGTFRDLLAARLVGVRGQPEGLIVVSDKHGGRDFAAHDEALLRQLAAITSLALQHIEVRQAAEAANVAKSEFLATMSHELRTPMNAILGMTDLALGETLSAEVRDYLQTTRESADVLLELLDQILDFSRIEAGRFELESAPFRLRRTVENVVKTLAARAHQKGLELVCDLPDELPDHVVGDRLRLRQVLTNLIGNAIKFTATGEILVRVSVDELTTDSTSACFSVTDSGIGIPLEDQKKIFSPFTQGDASTTRHFGGSGLGLAISERLVSLMGGRISVESQPGHGSSFSFTIKLPIQAGTIETAERGSVPDWEAFRDVPVLVVASNQTHRRVLERILASWSMRPELATDVPGALTKIHHAAASGQGFRLVLADAVMPTLDGFTLAEWLAKEPQLAGPAILMVSATDRQARAKRLVQWGGLCLEKPISRSALFAVVAEALGLGRQAAKPAAGFDGALLLTVPARFLRVLVAEDTPANQKLVRHVLGKRGHSIEIAQDGQEALELLGQRSFDVILMDVQMPVMDGFETTAAVRRLPDPKKARLPIIAMTAHALKGDDQRCIQAGMDAYLSKPIKGAELIQTVERLADAAFPGGADWEDPRTSLAGAAPTLADGDVQVECSPEIFDLHEGIECCFCDYSMFRKMVVLFFDETEPLLEQIRTSAQNGDADGVARAAHRLKGTVAYLGASRATEAVNRVEQLGMCSELCDVADAAQQLERELDRLKDALTPHRKA